MLGAGYERLTLPLADDDEGEVVATLVRRVPGQLPAASAQGRPADEAPDSGVDVLYVDAALAVIAAADVGQGDAPAVSPAGPTPRRLVLMGHSTGGLTLSRWVSRNPGRVSALILNSPWLRGAQYLRGRLPHCA